MKDGGELGLSEEAIEALALDRVCADATAMSPDRLRASLEARKLPTWDVLFSLNADYGGCSPASEVTAGVSIFRADDESLTLPPLRDRSGAVTAVPVGFFVLAEQRHPILIDELGQVRRASGELIAASARLLLEKLARVSQWSLPGMFLATLRPRLGEALAARLGARLDNHASDAYHTFWSAPGILLVDRFCEDGFESQTVGDTVASTRAFSFLVDCVDAGRDVGEMVEVAIRGGEELVEHRAPREAPPMPSAEELRAKRAVRALPREPGEIGWVYVHRSPQGVAIHTVHERSGRVVRTREIYQDGALVLDYTSLAEALRPYLSPRTWMYYEALSLRRAPAGICSREVLARLLEAHHLEPWPAILDFDECCGGVELDGCLWGVYMWASRGSPPREIVAPSGVRLVRVGSALLEDNHFYLDGAGALYEDARDLGIGPTRVADVWPKHFERALTAGRLRPERPFLLEANMGGGAIVADLFGLSLLPEGSDSHAAIWLREDIEVYEQRTDLPGRSRGSQTVVVTAALDDAVRSLWALAAAAPHARFTFAASRALPGGREPPGEPALRVPVREYPPGDREVRVFGRPEQFRVWVGTVGTTTSR